LVPGSRVATLPSPKGIPIIKGGKKQQPEIHISIASGPCGITFIDLQQVQLENSYLPE
jgi:hypothetical protein